MATLNPPAPSRRMPDPTFHPAESPWSAERVRHPPNRRCWLSRAPGSRPTSVHACCSSPRRSLSKAPELLSVPLLLVAPVRSVLLLAPHSEPLAVLDLFSAQRSRSAQT